MQLEYWFNIDKIKLMQIEPEFPTKILDIYNLIGIR